MNSNIVTMSSGLQVHVGSSRAEPRFSRSFEYNSENAPEGYLHFVTALDFANNFSEYGRDKHKQVKKAWKFLASKAFETDSPLYNPVESFAFRNDFVVRVSRQIEERLNAGCTVDEHYRLPDKQSALLIHLANVQLSAEPPIPELNLHPIDVTMVVPTQS